MLSRILDFFWSPCPSGLPHRTRWGMVTNWLGKPYCWHRDCLRANFEECGVNVDPCPYAGHCNEEGLCVNGCEIRQRINAALAKDQS